MEKQLTPDQIAASKRVVKYNPHTDPELIRVVREAINKYKQDNKVTLQCSLKSDNNIIAVIVNNKAFIAKDYDLSEQELKEVESVFKQYKDN